MGEYEIEEVQADADPDEIDLEVEDSEDTPFATWATADQARELVVELMGHAERFQERAGDIVALAQAVKNVQEILYQPEILVTDEPSCVRCNAVTGEPHKLRGCAATARIDLLRDLI